MRKGTTREKYKTVLTIFLSILFIFLAYSLFDEAYISGMNFVDLNVSSSYNGSITAFVYSPKLNLTQSQNTTIEFTNIGTTYYNVTIKESIYIYENGLLNLTVQFYDTTVPLYPGMKKYFKTYYVPPRIGVYYIKAFVNYGSRNVETWRTFTVSLPYEEEGGGESNQTTGGGAVPPSMTIFERAQTIKLDINYSNYFEMYAGQTLMSGINAINRGNVTLDRLRTYVSTPNTIDVSISPKEILDLDPNESSLFLMSISVKEGAPLGVHLIVFDVVADKAKQTGTIQINVTEKPLSNRKEVANRIASNKYFIVELERQILQAFVEGINTTFIEDLLNQAKSYLETAEDYFEIKDYENAIEQLDKKDEKLNSVVFELANEAFRIYVPPAFSPFWLLFLAILIAIIFLILEEKKRKEKKPKLLRRSEESEI